MAARAQRQTRRHPSCLGAAGETGDTRRAADSFIAAAAYPSANTRDNSGSDREQYSSFAVLKVGFTGLNCYSD